MKKRPVVNVQRWCNLLRWVHIFVNLTERATICPGRHWREVGLQRARPSYVNSAQRNSEHTEGGGGFTLCTGWHFCTDGGTFKLQRLYNTKISINHQSFLYFCPLFSLHYEKRGTGPPHTEVSCVHGEKGAELHSPNKSINDRFPTRIILSSTNWGFQFRE